MRTTPQLVRCLPRDDRRARKSTAVPFWSYPTLVPTPELVCHPRVVSRPPSRDVATPPRLREHRSATDDREASGHNISIPARAPEAQAQQCLARSAGSALRLARCDRNTRKLAWDERTG